MQQLVLLRARLAHFVDQRARRVEDAIEWRHLLVAVVCFNGILIHLVACLLLVSNNVGDILDVEHDHVIQVAF